jgi:hypothetical protein
MAGGGTPIGTFGIIPWPIAMPIGAKRPEEKKQYPYQQVSSCLDTAMNKKYEKLTRNQVSQECTILLTFIINTHKIKLQ